ncbi:hypothetical protein C489_19036 [Natrinema versiforme JCM 10478]|uniref:Uncharacterized protein n=1 Tax=Natrinema versiforme JCM 10478 TaxID=1227496 RepID=L9XRT1_9EURY|nr:hypothetical protein C489_19036 [Natrinema versiforme JCM 10478]
MGRLLVLIDATKSLAIALEQPDTDPRNLENGCRSFGDRSSSTLEVAVDDVVIGRQRKESLL